MALDPILAQHRPGLVLVQGDTTTALAAAITAFYHRLPVGHVEAGLRSGDPTSPFPEEMNRRLITRLATFHFAATNRNRDALLAEGIAPDNIVVTGNPVVDSLHEILKRTTPTPLLRDVIQATDGLKRIALTTHRRESFGAVLAGNLKVLRDFVERHPDVALIFPVHPNPAVQAPAHAILAGLPRIHLLPPLDYCEFIGLLSQAWLIVSDSGGIQEEAPTLGKPLLVLRANTERPEAIECGAAHLVGDNPERLRALLEEHYHGGELSGPGKIANPFGQGDSGRRIAQAIGRLLAKRLKDASSAARQTPRS